MLSVGYGLVVKLTELDARWVGLEGTIWGLTFLCPHCRAERLAALFQPFIRSGRDPNWAAWERLVAEQPVWRRVSGESFEDLTLSPSVNAEGHWHGFVNAGKVTSC